MRRFAIGVTMAALVVASAAAPAYAGGRGWYGGGWRGSVGIYVGPGWGWGLGWPYYGWPYAYGYRYPAYYGWPYAYGYRYPYYGYADSYPYVPSRPPVYVEKTPATSYWYYCTDPAGYYPYVQTCNRAWMQVLPQNVPDASGAPPGGAQQ